MSRVESNPDGLADDPELRPLNEDINFEPMEIESEKKYKGA